MPRTGERVLRTPLGALRLSGPAPAPVPLGATSPVLCAAGAQLGSVALALAFARWLEARGAAPPAVRGPDVLVGWLLLAYFAVVFVTRIALSGRLLIFEMAWGCNVALVVGALGCFLGQPLVIGGALAMVAVDQLMWCARLC